MYARKNQVAVKIGISRHRPCAGMLRGSQRAVPPAEKQRRMERREVLIKLHPVGNFRVIFSKILDKRGWIWYTMNKSLHLTNWGLDTPPCSSSCSNLYYPCTLPIGVLILVLECSNIATPVSDNLAPYQLGSLSLHKKRNRIHPFDRMNAVFLYSVFPFSQLHFSPECKTKSVNMHFVFS